MVKGFLALLIMVYFMGRLSGEYGHGKVLHWMKWKLLGCALLGFFVLVWIVKSFRNNKRFAKQLYKFENKFGQLTDEEKQSSCCRWAKCARQNSCQPKDNKDNKDKKHKKDKESKAEVKVSSSSTTHDDLKQATSQAEQERPKRYSLCKNCQPKKENSKFQTNNKIEKLEEIESKEINVQSSVNTSNSGNQTKVMTNSVNMQTKPKDLSPF